MSKILLCRWDPLQKEHMSQAQPCQYIDYYLSMQRLYRVSPIVYNMTYSTLYILYTNIPYTLYLIPYTYSIWTIAYSILPIVYTTYGLLPTHVIHRLLPTHTNPTRVKACQTNRPTVRQKQQHTGRLIIAQAFVQINWQTSQYTEQWTDRYIERQQGEAETDRQADIASRATDWEAERQTGQN